MSSRLTLICHARTSAQRLAAFPQDEAIEDRRLPDKAAIRNTLARVDRAWTAPEFRTRQTVEVLGLDADIGAALRDCDYGSWRGLRLTDIQSREPDAVAEWITNPAAAPHGGESIMAVLKRIGDWLRGYDEPGHTIAVTHQAVIRSAIIDVLKAPPQTFWHIDVEPLSFVDLRRNGMQWRLRFAGTYFKSTANGGN